MVGQDRNYAEGPVMEPCDSVTEYPLLTESMT